MIAWDTETRSLRWWENPAFLASWDTGSGGRVAPIGPHVEQDDGRADYEVRELLESHDHHIGANLKFDLHMAREALGVELVTPGRKLDDVLTMSRLVYGARRSMHGLKELATDHVDPSAKDAEKLMGEAYHEVSGRASMEYDDAYYVTWKHKPDVVEHYAKLDAEYTLALYDHLKPQIDADPKLASLYKLERDVQTVLYEAEKKGVTVDPNAVARLKANYTERDAAARAALVEHLGFVPEGDGSQDRLREALVAAGVELTERTENTGELAINRRALSKHAEHPAVAALFEWRRVGKFLSTYIGPMEGRDVVHTNFKQAEAWTGRMAAASPNMQNLPKRTEVGKASEDKIRSVFVPREGMEFIVADFDSIEMRVLAYYLGDKHYRELIANGDPHAITAAAAFSQVSVRPEDFFKGTSNRWLRDIAKQVTYSIVYGGGGPVVMDTVNKFVLEAGHPEYMVDLDGARAIRRKIAGAIPGFKQFTDSPFRGKDYPRGRLYEQLLNSQEGEYGYVRTLMGRKQWIKLDKAYVALSGLIQGSAADIMKQAAVNLHEALKPHGGYPLLFVHDEAVVEVPLGWGERLKPVVVEAMVAAADIDPALQVEANVTDKSYAHA